jgi:signal transduction histidine kinase
LLLWFHRNSILDLWLMVAVTAWLLEIALQCLFLAGRFSAGWYVGRIYSLIAGSVLMIVLLSEATTLYAHLARSVIRQRAARQARQVAMDAIAASIAHEVSQPLGAISANAEAALIYLNKADYQQVRAAIEDIAGASIRGKEVVSSLRAMLKRDAVGRAPCDVNAIVREAIEILHIDLRTKGIFVAQELRAGLPLVMGDKRQLQQVFLNLISNAIDSMSLVSNRARVMTITSRLTESPAHVVVAVKDSGEGIKDGDEDLVCEPFFTTKPSGTGIGLTVCRSIIDSHGGELLLFANTPYGAAFEVWLPVVGGIAR